LTGGQTISATQFNNLTISNTLGTNSAAANVVVNGALVTSTGGTTDLSTFTLSGTLTSVTNNGIIKTSNTSATPIPTGKTWGGTLEYAAVAGGQTIVAGNYGNLTLRNTSAANTLINGGTIGISGVFTPGSFSSNTITNNIVDFNGTGAQTIPAFNYNSLTLSGARTNSVTLSSTGTIGIAGTFSPTATFSSGGYIVTNSTVNFNNTAGQTIPSFNYFNLTTTNTTSSSTLAASPAVNVANAFTNAGKFSLTPGSGTMTYAAGGTFVMNASNNITGMACKQRSGKCYRFEQCACICQ
jgi:hypothetical protein